MFNFDSNRPTKQGTKYGLSLGQNDGPYLVKDVMMTNQKSVQLLTGNQIAKAGVSTLRNSVKSASGHGSAIHNYQPPTVYDDQLGEYTNYGEVNKAQLTASESLGINSTFQQDQSRKLKESLQQYKELITEYKNELKNMNKTINEANQSNMGEIQPMMKMFYENLKQQLQESKNDNYQLQREIEQLNRDKTQIQQQIAFSEKRSQDLEKFMGVSAKLDESDESENLDFQ